MKYIIELTRDEYIYVFIALEELKNKAFKTLEVPQEISDLIISTEKALKGAKIEK